MLSSDQNIETISQLIEMVKHNIELRKEYTKLDVVEKVVRLLSASALALLLTVIIAAILLFASAGAAAWLSQYIGLTSVAVCLSQESISYCCSWSTAHVSRGLSVRW